MKFHGQSRVSLHRIMTVLLVFSCAAMGCREQKTVPYRSANDGHEKLKALLAAMDSADGVIITCSMTQQYQASGQELKDIKDAFQADRLERITIGKIPPMVNVWLMKDGSKMSQLTYFKGSVIEWNGAYFRLQTDPFMKYYIRYRHSELERK